MLVFLITGFKILGCHGIELTPSLLWKVDSALYMCSYCYKELKAYEILRIWDVNAMYVAEVD